MDENIRIAIVSTLMPETHYTRYLINSLAKNFRKIKWYVYANKNENIKPLNLKFILRQCWSQNFLYPIQIIKEVIRDRIKIVHLQHEINMYGGPITAILFPVLILLLKLARKGVIVTIHAVVPKKEINLDFLETFSWPKNKFVTILVKIAFFYIYTTICRLSDVIIVHSNYLKSVLISDYRAKKDKIKVIAHGIPERIISKEVKKIEAPWWEKVKSKKIILYFGYLVKRKGLEYLIYAFERICKRHNDYTLVLAGGSLRGQEDYLENLKKIVYHRGLSNNVIFTSFVQENELEKLFLLSEFVVLPCIYSISASGPLAQAISFYKPVIATNLGTFHEEIDEGIDGFLCPPKDIESLAKTMLKLIENPMLLMKMSENMMKKARERKWSNIAEKTYGIYRNIGNKEYKIW